MAAILVRLPLLSIRVVLLVWITPPVVLIVPEAETVVPPEIAPDSVRLPMLVKLPLLSIRVVPAVWIVPVVELIVPLTAAVPVTAIPAAVTAR